MDVLEYRRKRSAATPPPRGKCLRCLRPPVGCFCRALRAFDPGMRFLILTHIRESQKRIATGRMAALGLIGARQVVGEDYTEDPVVNALLADPALYPVVVYPGAEAENLSRDGEFSVPGPLTPLFILIDGTWSTAPKMLAKSRNLTALPRVTYDALAPSGFHGVRRQPAEYCHSTIEAIHQVIELAGPRFGYHGREHDLLLRAFGKLVDQQRRSQLAKAAVALD